MTRTLREQRGSALVIALMVLLTLSGLLTALASRTEYSSASTRDESEGIGARYVARAAFERACVETLAGNADWTTLGTSDELTDMSFSSASSYDLSYETTGVADSVRVNVIARYHATTRQLVFIATRATSGSNIDLRGIEDFELERSLGERLAS